MFRINWQLERAQTESKGGCKKPSGRTWDLSVFAYFMSLTSSAIDHSATAPLTFFSLDAEIIKNSLGVDFSERDGGRRFLEVLAQGQGRGHLEVATLDPGKLETGQAFECWGRSYNFKEHNSKSTSKREFY